VAKSVLEAQGFRTLTAGDGRQGVEVFREHGPRIAAVLLDMTMPAMSGLQVLREIRRIRREIPVILMSGYSEEEIAADFAQERPNGFLQKPFNVGSFLGKLQEVLPS
jgi:CheY-like chemotaxis protein